MGKSWSRPVTEVLDIAEVTEMAPADIALTGFTSNTSGDFDVDPDPEKPSDLA